MKTVPVYDTEGKRTGEAQLKDYFFGCEVNLPVMHLVVRPPLAAARPGAATPKGRRAGGGGGGQPRRPNG
jgi:large subunit ribosomal protein L4